MTSNINLSLQEYKLQKWAAIIMEAKNNGMAQEKWAEEHGITKSTYWYWHKRVSSLAEDELVKSETVFAELNPPDSVVQSCSPVVIRHGNVSIEISDSVSDSLLMRILKAVDNAY